MANSPQIPSQKATKFSYRGLWAALILIIASLLAYTVNPYLIIVVAICWFAFLFGADAYNKINK